VKKQKATPDSGSPERREFLSMVVDAVLSRTTEYSTWKTRFIGRLVETDVDAKTMARLNRALDANPQKTG
jgi:hypothetical protein